MSICSELKKFSTTISDFQIKKREILNFFNTSADKEISLQKVMEFLNLNFKDSIISENPTNYDSKKFIEIVNTLPDDENIIDIEQTPEIDASKDTSLISLVKTKSYKDLEELLVESVPVNIYISGETGLGKSSAVLDIARNINKQVIRVGMSMGTDIDDLIGGIRIVDGNTIFDPGPVALAMTTGSILLLDEVDFASPRVLVELHPVLEGKGILAKKARKMIYPAKGFCVVATGNTKGVGDSSGKYIGSNNLNHAFLERFAAGIEFIPPSIQELELILKTTIPDISYGLCRNLCEWYAKVLESYLAGAVEEYVHLRKMIDIAKIAIIFELKTGLETEMSKVLKLSLGLKDPAVISALTSLYLTIKKSYELESNIDKDKSINEDGPLKIDENGNAIPF